MLVLRRKIGERIVLDGGIEITIVKVGTKQVDIGFNAPASIGILRGEVIEKRSNVQPFENGDATL